jgi:hypothetical protein
LCLLCGLISFAIVYNTNTDAEATGLTYKLGETNCNEEFMFLYTAPLQTQLLAEEDKDDILALITTHVGSVDATGHVSGRSTPPGSVRELVVRRAGECGLAQERHHDAGKELGLMW